MRTEILSRTTPEAGHLSDALTVLVCTSRHGASKRIIAEDAGAPRVIGFNAGLVFAVMRKPVRNIRELSEILLALERMPDVLVIRGDPIPVLNLNAGVRRLKKNFQTPLQGRRWVLIDFDKIALPADLSVKTDAKAVAEYLVSLLPAEFHQVSYHYQLSSSAGLKHASVASMHIWFWLTQPWPDKALKLWAKQVNQNAGRKLIDPALFNAVQAHYVAAPLFEGMKDPFPTRSALVVKDQDAVELEFIEQPKDEWKGTASVRDGERSPGFEAILDKIGDHPGGEGFHEPIIRAIASYVATHGRDGTDVAWLFEAVRKRVLDADRSQHDDGYVEHMASREHIGQAIDGALEKYGDPNPRRKARIVQGVAPHFASEPSHSADEAKSRLEKSLKSIVKVVPWRSG